MRALTSTHRKVASFMLAGWTRREIAEHLGVRPKTISCHVLAIHYRAGQDLSRPLADVLRDLGIEPTTEPRPVIPGAVTRTKSALAKNRPVSDADVARAAELYAGGHRYCEIARQMRRTVKQVGYLLERSRQNQPQPRRAEKRVLVSADEIVAAALESAKRRECAWL